MLTVIVNLLRWYLEIVEKKIAVYVADRHLYEGLGPIHQGSGRSDFGLVLQSLQYLSLAALVEEAFVEKDQV